MAVAALMVLLLPVCAGCVTERRTDLPGSPVKPAATERIATKAGAKPATSAANTPKAELPKGPVADPAKGYTTATNVQVEIRPLGRIGYDGQQLPMCSPDGNFLVTQEGPAPTWPTILAEPEQQPAIDLRLAIYDTSTGSLRPIKPVEPLPAGLMLGRAADSEGFLVELPRAGGARWIGKVDWASGRLSWLVKGDMVNAHGIFDLAGDLIYTRRKIGGAVTSLVLRPREGRESVKEPLDGGYVYPCAVDSPEMVYAFRGSRAGLELEAIRLDRSDPSTPRLADTRQSWRIMGEPDVLVAHQMASTVQPVWPSPGAFRGESADAPEFDVLTTFDPRKSRMARFNWRTGGIEALAARSIAACPAQAKPTPGYFCTAPEGLVFIARPLGGWLPAPPENSPVARVFESPYVPRALATQPPMFLLMGPVKGSTDKIEVMKMAPAN